MTSGFEIGPIQSRRKKYGDHPSKSFDDIWEDYGTCGKVYDEDVAAELIHKKFLSLPVQDIPTRLWGISGHNKMKSLGND